MINNTIILSAGLGTRLRPMTNQYPKPIIPFCNTTPLEINLSKIAKHFEKHNFYINYHYLPEKFESKLKIYSKKYNIKSHFEKNIRDTGGGIANFHQIAEDFFVHNGDILTDINFEKLGNFHQKNNTLATLALIDFPSKNNVLYDKKNNIIDFLLQNNENALCYSGVSAFSPEIFQFFPKEEKFSIIKVLKEIIKKYPDKVKAYISKTHSYWYDIGTIEQYFEFHRKIFAKEISLNYDIKNIYSEIPKNIILGKNVWIGENVTFDDSKELVINNSIIWSNNKINNSLENKIVGEYNEFIVSI